MAKLIVDFYRTKTNMLCLALQGRKKRIKITDTTKPGIKIRDTSKPAPKVDMATVAKALGASMVIPLDWVYSFKADEDTLTIMFEDDVSFRVDGDKLFFVRGDESGFACTDAVSRVYKFGEGLEILWEK